MMPYPLPNTLLHERVKERINNREGPLKLVFLIISAFSTPISQKQDEVRYNQGPDHVLAEKKFKNTQIGS
jgi:hypothetical protein